MEAKIYTQGGKEAGKITLPENIFGLPWNADLVHQVVTSLMTNKRANLAHTKTRGEVSGGGKKPWRQKGTGRARHGSTRSPIWVGGGIAHGPRKDTNYERTVPRKMKMKALFTILSKKFKDGEVAFVDSLEFKLPKTKDAVKVLGSLSKVENLSKIATKKTNAALIATLKKDIAIEKSFANIGSVLVDEFRNLNPLDLMKYKYLVVLSPSEAVKLLESKLAK